MGSGPLDRDFQGPSTSVCVWGGTQTLGGHVLALRTFLERRGSDPGPLKLGS